MRLYKIIQICLIKLVEMVHFPVNKWRVVEYFTVGSK